jgi:hypothetical protein
MHSATALKDLLFPIAMRDVTVGSRERVTSVSVSTTYTLPWASIATPVGLLRWLVPLVIW